MKINKAKILLTAAKLRRKAEEQMKAKMSKLRSPRTNEETLKLTHELEVYQIELMLQVEELYKARDEVESGLGKYIDLFDFAPIGYFTVSRNGAINIVNLTGANLLGVARSQLIGRRFLLYVADEARPLFSDYLERVFTGQGKETCEVALMGKGHSPVFTHIEAVTVGTGQESRLAVIDITDRKRAEDALAQEKLKLEELNKTLELRISKAVDEILRKDQAMIQQNSLATMGEMISNIAHQWRQPLNGVSLIIQCMQEEYNSGTLTSDKMDSSIDSAMEMLVQMSRTIDDFRNFFRTEKEKHTFLISDAVNHAVSLVSSTLKSHNIQVEIETNDDETVFGFQNEYSQVLLNLFSNACDACLECSEGDRRIIIRITRENERSVLYIRDNCGGIPDDVMPKIFDPYFTTRGPDRGTGIGLYMSRMIIEQNMGGHLTSRNVDGGAEFRIEI